jgi:hypothetical protein
MNLQKVNISTKQGYKAQVNNIKEWYTHKYPLDELGKRLNEYATFHGLFECLDSYEDVYEYLGYDDSLIRERCFEKLSDIMEVPYSEVYEQWILGK